MNVASPSSAVQLVPVGQDAVGTTSGRWRGLPAWLGRSTKVCETKRWIACCALLYIAFLSGCQRPGEPVGPTKTRRQASEQVTEPISRDRAIEMAEAETRRLLDSWGRPVPEALETTVLERPEGDGWSVACVYAPRSLNGYVAYEVLPDGRIYELDDWFAHEWNSLSEEERKCDIDELLRWFATHSSGNRGENRATQYPN